MYVTKHNELIVGKVKYMRKYCKKEGWDFKTLKEDQAIEIRDSQGYKKITKQILKGSYK